jgi:hypothetical protein
MTEEYLHFLWDNKRIMSTQLQLTNGEVVSIKNFGRYNAFLKGPDFFHGVISIDGIELHGPIELHVKSSDWYLHKHHLDANYNNVILHVVHEHDKEIVQNGRVIPTLELFSLIDEIHYLQYKRILNNSRTILCGTELTTVESTIIHEMLSKNIYVKLNKKVELIRSYAQSSDNMWELFLAAAFGLNHNKEAFLDLVSSVSIKEIKKCSPEKRYQLLLAESGMMIKDGGYKLNWHFKGARPKNFPTVRLKQYAYFLEELKMDDLASLKDTHLILSLFHSRTETVRRNSRISKSLFDLLIINAVVPYLWYLAEEKPDYLLQEIALEILEKTSPEHNGIVKKWKEIGLNAKSAYESQGLIALYRYYCCRKKCLSCGIGRMVLNY